MENVSNKRVIFSGLISGLFVGIINGFFGGGGGMLVVPVLVFLLKMPEKTAHATAIFVILPLSIISSIIYLINGSMNWEFLLYCGIGFLIGGVTGALLLKKLNNKFLRIIFAIIMIAAGVKMLF